jgi:hypothetical protein
MSTPVSDTPPRVIQPTHHRTGTPDLQAQMQHMIDLQYEQQKQISEEHEGGEKPKNVPLGVPVEKHNVPLGVPVADKAPAGQALSFSTFADSSGIISEGSSKALGEALYPLIPPAPNNTINNSNKNKNYWANYPDHGVGQGTLFFSSPSLGDTAKVFNRQSKESLQSSPLPAPPLVPRQNSGLPVPAQNISSLTMASQGMNLGSYGALDETSGVTTPVPPPPLTTMTQVNQQQEQQDQHQQQQHLLHQGEHEFHYGNPDYHDPFSNTIATIDRNNHHGVGSGDLDFPVAHSWGLSKYCCCLWAPIVHAFGALAEAESLHRSFCYGAIDGMLTGSGIVATFCGIGLLSSHSSHALRGVVVVFTTATCFADSVCMALGHVWTTHVMACAAARERTAVREQLHDSKADAKGQLVDMLLAKGMLKIDAMSLADTLEGYPDLFISALTGDALPGTESHLQSTLPDFVGGDASNKNAGLPFRVFPSYGRLSEYEMDPDAQAVNAAVRESRHEAIFMMLGFSIFAIVPSVIFWCAPVTAAVLSTATAVAAAATSGDDNINNMEPESVTAEHGHVLVSPITLVVSVTAGIMWCLGVWKSQFLDCNWMLFGIETVVVMLVCITSAYSVGALLNHVFLSSFEFLLTVIDSTTSMTSNEL